MLAFTYYYLSFCVETGGTDGLFAQKTLEITNEVISSYKNQGGFDMLGRTRDQIRTTEQVKAAMNTCQALKLDALVIIGGIIY
jgi:pyrophosphate--fructose-6-phosphate 1-phosphotransferase